ncbi:MAG: hypothetical protein ACE5J5_04810 [Candidatus Hydrothermarchaeales archaeon]
MDLKEDYMDIFSATGLLAILSWLFAIVLAWLFGKWFPKKTWERLGLTNEDMKAVLAGPSILFAAAIIGSGFPVVMESLGLIDRLSIKLLIDFWFLGIIASLILFGAVISFAIFGLLKKIFKVK